MNSQVVVSFAALIAFLASFSLAFAEEKLQQSLEAELSNMECPGALVGVQVGSSSPQVFVLGVADVKSKAAMRRDFHMRIASVTKPFLGNAVLLLADEGKLSVDDPISKYVDGVPAGDEITLRQLANNTSGIFNSIENKDFQAAIVAEPKRQWQEEEILRYSFAKPSYAEPGKGWRYSNTNAVLLGKVLEKVTGKPYATVIKERVIEPLKLAHTGFVEGAEPPNPVPSEYRNGYEDKWLGYGKTFYDVTGYSASWTGAAGNMYSTVDDLLAAAKPLLTGALLSDQSRGEFQKWVVTGYDDIEYGFCLGKRHDWIGHSGDVPGASAFLAYLPAKDAVIVVMSNLSNNKDGTIPAERLRDVVIEQLELKEK